jgi:hypothetical protein
MFAMLQCLDAVPGMAGSIGGNENGFDLVVLDQLFQRRISCAAPGLFGQTLAAIGKQIAYRHDFDVRMILKAKRGGEFANAIPDQAYPYLALGYWSPAF